mgnify:CR=1 FL=1
MRTAAYKVVGVASDRRRRKNVPRHLLCSLIGKSLFLKRLKKYVSSKRGIENRRLLEKIKTFFSKVVVIIEFMKKIVHVQKIAVAHMFNIMSCHAFWRILNVLQSKFLCKFFCVCSIQK